MGGMVKRLEKKFKLRRCMDDKQAQDAQRYLLFIMEIQIKTTL